MNEPVTVSVMGSCVTRDIFNRSFNHDYKTWYAVGPTTNQSSMIALMSPPVEAEWEPVSPMKPYGIWNVNSDLSKEILPLLRSERPDYVVLDFFGDVFFGVLRLADGRFVTNNRWRLWKTDLYQRLIDDPATEAIRWQDDEERYFELWREAMDRFAAYMRTECPDTKVIVHYGFNARQVLAKGAAYPTPLRTDKGARAEARRQNQIWDRLNTHAATAYGWDLIDLHEEWYVTFEEHPWGPLDVHYTLDYHRRFLAELHRIVLREQLRPELAERVDAIAAAARRRVRREVKHWRALHKSLGELASQPRRRGLFGRREPEGPDLGRPPLERGTDHRLLEELRGDVDEATWQRVAELVRSADLHVEWVREVWRARISEEWAARA